MSSAPPSSTPTRSSDAIFSDDVTRQRESSPPSSPPGFPWELQQKQAPQSIQANTPSSPPQKNAFSLLGKRKALDPISDNARPSKSQRPASKPLTQMQISLGQKVQTKCKQCGMEYVLSTSEDRKLHDKFHRQNSEGYDVGKTFVSKTEDQRHRLFKGVKEGDAIVLVDCRDTHHRKKRGQAVLDIVQRELGAVAIPEHDIWDDESRYRSFLYIRDTKCVGFLLAEDILEAFRVERPQDAPVKDRPKDHSSAKARTALEALKARKIAAAIAKVALAESIREADTQPLQLSSTKTPAFLGISRIWTSPTHRGEGIARKLIDTAIGEHNLRYAGAQKKREEEKHRQDDDAKEHKTERTMLPEPPLESKKIERRDQVAFSQPTDLGARLARRWFGKPYGWSVYID